MRHLIGHSRDGRPIYAYENGDPRGRKILVVGCIHGNEQAGIPVAEALERVKAPAGVDLWLVPVANPDGVAADTRQNGAGVDLNRNFPFGWRDLEGIYDSGAHALSEPESRALARLALRLHPAISIWFHQHLGVVDTSEGSVAIERRFARLVGEPAVPLTDYPGSAVSWENHRFPGTTAFVVELGAGPLSASSVARYANAVLAITRAANG